MRVVSSVSFFSPAEVAQLSAETGVSQSSTMVRRQAYALGFLQALGARIGFPQRTVATAQSFLLRFHLFYKPREFDAYEVAVACLVVASKINDTPKKPREVILSSWALRHPELVRGIPSAKAGGAHTSTASLVAQKQQQLGLGMISEADVDVEAIEKERKRVVTIESLIFQTIAFNFNVDVADCFHLTIKIARHWTLDKSLAKLAWQLAADCHRTYAALCYPPSTIALGSIYCGALLMQRRPSQSEGARRAIARFQGGGTSDANSDNDPIARMEDKYCTTIDSVEEVVHALLDLILAAAATYATTNTLTPISPATPASPAEPLSSEHANGADRRGTSSVGRQLPAHVVSPPPYGLTFCLSEATANATTLSSAPPDIAGDMTQIKIAVRQEEDRRRVSTPAEGTTKRMPSTAVAATLVRQFDRGGVVGQEVDDDFPPPPTQAEAAAPVSDTKQYQLATLQRFLF